jgi:hypothetical protein
MEDSVQRVNVVPLLSLAVGLPLPVQTRGVTSIMTSYTTCQQIALRRRVDDVHDSQDDRVALFNSQDDEAHAGVSRYA